MKFLLTLFFAAQVSLVFAATSPAPRPNILFIFSDDHAQHAISAYGSKVNRTPHLDRLGAAGIRFNHAFVTNSICTPSRAVVLTGKYSHANGTPVFAIKGENLTEYWDYTHRIFDFGTANTPNEGPNMILDDGGDATLLMHLGTKAETDPSVLNNPGSEEEVCLF